MRREPSVIRIVAGVATDGAGRVLLVRKAGTRAFMQPGGKAQPGENPIETLRREIAEELGCDIATDEGRYLGRRTAPAANEPGLMVEAELYGFDLVGEPRPMGEIAELAWVASSGGVDVPLAPLTESHILPIVRQARRRRFSG